MSEVSCIDFENRDLGSIYSPSPAVSYNFHENIFDQHNGRLGLEKTVILCKAPKEVEQRTQKVAKIASSNANASGRADITFEWGGKDGPSVSGSISGSCSDDRGNKAEVRVSVESDGSGKATVSAEHDKKPGS
jgi:hypothetical protein